LANAEPRGCRAIESENVDAGKTEAAPLVAMHVRRLTRCFDDIAADIVALTFAVSLIPQ
jgi:hypothetical protein